jgi:hypothetical protein
MADVLHGSGDADETVTINADFVRRQASEAVRKFFRPVTAAFEDYPSLPVPATHHHPSHKSGHSKAKAAGSKRRAKRRA